ncbi:MAG: GTP-binding protein [Cytophagales bacterium]|nr:MAG: GTP-binding protein [Cytophagales bacterium]TAF62316.1 MAG: GTP-binding protein [Cytophagales bacterium]
MHTLKFITAGNVDDGKSTLIGRMLYDSQSIHTDQLGVIKQQSKLQTGEIDLSLITDGLRAEREQGITIDVAYKYFATNKRKFIIADAPGHEQYTRNMITGASGADLIVLLIDARKGITEQTKRHASIGSLMGIKHAVVAINKMDLVNNEQAVYEQIVSDFETKKTELNYKTVAYIPLSALLGHNVVNNSGQIDWYEGMALLPYLEQISVATEASEKEARFQVQWVIRPKDDAYHDYRGYAGMVLSGSYHVGQAVRVLPSGLESHIKRIERHQKNVQSALTGQNVVLHLTDNLDISRGDAIIKADSQSIQNRQDAQSWLCWLDTAPLQLGKTYLLQHRFKTVRVKVQALQRTWSIKEWHFETADSLKMNDIGQVSLRFSQPLAYDSFADVASNGCAILIDDTNFNTVGACMFL